MKFERIRLVLSGSCFFLLAVAAFGQDTQLAEKKREFDQSRIAIGQQLFEMGRTEYTIAIKNAFLDASFPKASSNIQQLSVEQLEILFAAYRAVAWITFDARAALDMLAIYDEIRSRTARAMAATPVARERAQRAYDTLVNARLFVSAERFARKYPDDVDELPYVLREIEPVPAFSPVYEVIDETSLNVKAIGIHEGEWLVASVHPGCAFSLEAMRYFEAHHEELARHLPKKIAWISSQRYTYTLPWVQRWNQRSNIVDIYVSSDDNRWPDNLALQITPVFYHVRDGRVVNRKMGWVGEKPEDSFHEFLTGFEVSSGDGAF